MREVTAVRHTIRAQHDHLGGHLVCDSFFTHEMLMIQKIKNKNEKKWSSTRTRGRIISLEKYSYYIARIEVHSQRDNYRYFLNTFLLRNHHVRIIAVRIQQHRTIRNTYTLLHVPVWSTKYNRGGSGTPYLNSYRRARGNDTFVHIYDDDVLLSCKVAKTANPSQTNGLLHHIVKYRITS